MATPDERFAEVDEAIEETNRRLRVIARQNAALAEMVEVLGGYVNTAIGHLQHHIADPDAHKEG